MKPKIVRNISQLLKTVLLFLFTTLLLYFISALLLSLLKSKSSDLCCPADKEIFITTNGVHLDIILPLEELNYEFLKKFEIMPRTKYVSFGWGDKQFYINTPEWIDLTFKTAFKALFLKSETAMHVTCYPKSYSSWRKIKICNSQLDILNSYIEKSFQKTGKGSLKKIAVPGYYETDAFYEAKGSFSLFNTCNVWVNKALKKTGIETSVWSPFDWGVLYYLPE